MGTIERPHSGGPSHPGPVREAVLAPPRLGIGGDSNGSDARLGTALTAAADAGAALTALRAVGRRFAAVDQVAGLVLDLGEAEALRVLLVELGVVVEVPLHVAVPRRRRGEDGPFALLEARGHRFRGVWRARGAAGGRRRSG